MTQYFNLPVIPTALGYDPRLQLLHEEDATEALFDAIGTEGKGIYNIAADGVAYLSQAIRLLGRPTVPLVLPAAQTTAELLRRVGVVDFPTDQLRLILFGRVVDTRRAKVALGFAPRFTTVDCITDFRDHRIAAEAPAPGAHASWERELFEYLKQRGTSERERV